MKLSFVVVAPETTASKREKKHFEESLKKLRDIGYDGVEISIPNPRHIDFSWIKKLQSEYDLEIPALSTGLGYVYYGWNLSSPRDEARRGAIEAIKGHVNIASELGAMVIIGLLRGKVEKNDTYEKARNRLIQSLSQCIREAEREGVTIVLEPINRYETSFFNTVDEVLEVLNEIKSANLKLMIDTYHMNIEESSIIGSILKAKDQIAHVHIADSNRWPPGYGHIDFVEILRILKLIGYRHYLSAEVLPKPNFERAIRENYHYLRIILRLIEYY